MKQAAKITAITGATTHSIPCSPTFLLKVVRLSIPVGPFVGRLGGSHEWDSVIESDIGSENGLDV